MGFFKKLKEELSSVFREKRQYKVAAFYYPWYFKENWENNYHHYKPELGPYDTSEVGVAEKHINWASKYGINILLSSWWGRGSVSEWHLKKGILSAPNLDKIQFAIFYETW